MDVPSPISASLNPFLDPILQRAQADPQRLFGIFHDGADWTEISLGAALARALQCTALLQSLELSAGATVMLVLRHGLDAPACFIGAMLAGMVPSFLPCPSAKQDHTLYWSQHRTVLGFNRPPVVIVVDDLHDQMRTCAQDSGAAIIPLSQLDQHAPATVLPPMPHAHEVGLLQHSSGTTGMKKGVALSFGSIARQLAAYRDALEFDQATARIVSWLPLYHDMGLISSFLLPVWLGVPILSIDPFVWVAQPELFFDAAEQFRGTHAWLPNFAFLHLARRASRKRNWDLSSLQAVISCSEPCKAAAFDVFIDRFAAWGIRPATLQTCYAMAETVFAVSQSDPARPVRRVSIDPACVRGLGAVRPPPPQTEPLILLSNGRPIAGCQVAILKQTEWAGENQLGEICVQAEYMFSGYHLNPSASAEAFHQGWYRTGDIGFVEQGEVFVVGRIKELIIVNGKNVFVHDIEAAVSRVSGVKPGRCVAFGRYSDKSGSESLVVVAERDTTLSTPDPAQDRNVQRDINRAVVEEVGVTCGDIRVVDAGWLIKTTSGKTSRADNAVKYARDFGLGSA